MPFTVRRLHCIKPSISLWHKTKSVYYLTLQLLILYYLDTPDSHTDYNCFIAHYFMKVLVLCVCCRDGDEVMSQYSPSVVSYALDTEKHRSADCTECTTSTSRSEFRRWVLHKLPDHCTALIHFIYFTTIITWPWICTIQKCVSG